LERHIAAIGGREARRALKSLEAEREIEIFGMPRSLYEYRDLTSDRFYTKSESSNGVVETGFDGKRAWQKTPFFRGYLSDTDPQAKNMRRKRHGLDEYRERGEAFTRRPNQTIDGAECIVLEGATADFDPLARKAPVKYYLDAKTFLLRQMVAGAE